MQLLLFLILAFSCAHVHAQDSSVRFHNYKKFTLKVTVYQPGSNPHTSTGFLANFNDSSVKLSPAPIDLYNRSNFDTSLETITYNQIEAIRFKKKGAGWNGAGIGILIGIATGVAGGFISGDDTQSWFNLTAGQKAVAYGMSVGLLGGIIGGIVGGASRKTIVIEKKKEKMKEMNQTFLEMLYSK